MLKPSQSMEQDVLTIPHINNQNENEDFFSLLENLKTLSTGTKEKYDAQKTLVEKLRQKFLEQEDKIQKTQETISNLINAKRAAEEINVSLQGTATSLTEQLKSVVLEKDNAIAKNEETEAEISGLHAKIIDLTRKLNDSKMINDVEKTRKITEQLTRENENLKRKLHEADDVHRRTVSDLTAIQENHKQFVEILTKKNDLLKEEKNKWLLEKERLTDKIMLLEKSITKNETCNENEQSTLEAEISKLNSEVVDMTKVRERQTVIINELTKKLEHLDQEKSDWSIEKGSLDTEIATLKKQLATNNQYMEKQQMLNQSRIGELTNENNELSEQLRTARDSLTVLQVKVEFLEQSMDELQQNSEKQQEKNRLDFSERRQRENAAFELQLHQMQNDYSKAMEQIKILNDEKNATNAQLIDMYAKLSEKENELISLRNNEDNILALYGEATKKIAALEQQAVQERDLNDECKGNKSSPVTTHRQSFNGYHVGAANVDDLSRSSCNQNQSIMKHTEDFDESYEITNGGDSSENCSTLLDTSIVTSSENYNTNTEEYCEFCSAFGHDTFNCSTFYLRRKAQSTLHRS